MAYEIIVMTESGLPASTSGDLCRYFYAQGFAASVERSTKQGRTGVVDVFHIGTVRLAVPKLNNGRMVRLLSHEDWLQFNCCVNDWLDEHKLSANVKSSSYIIRQKFLRRQTYTQGNYHGAGDTWRDEVTTPSPGLQSPPGGSDAR